MKAIFLSFKIFIFERDAVHTAWLELRTGFFLRLLDGKIFSTTPAKFHIFFSEILSKGFNLFIYLVKTSLCTRGRTESRNI